MTPTPPAELTGSNAGGTVITFYSFKGGTGRSMALANAACLLAERTIREGLGGVLMVDWDLEAPGLHTFFRDKLSGFSPSQFDAREGVLDLFVALSAALPAKSRNVSLNESERIASALVDQLDLSRYVTPTDIPALSLMKAGQFGRDYERRVRAFDWHKLFRRSPSVIRLFAARLARDYRYVLLDSRTGMNDISGVCTVLMPERLVVVFTPNRQGLDGLFDFVAKATARRRDSHDIRPLLVFPLPSRIEQAEPALGDAWRNGSEDVGYAGYQHQFETLFKDIYGLNECDLTAYFDDVQIQHVPRYAFGEEIAVLSEKRGDRLSLTRSYTTFVGRLAGSEPPWATRATIERAPELAAPDENELPVRRAGLADPSEDGIRLLAKARSSAAPLVQIRDLVRDARRYFVTAWPERIQLLNRDPVPSGLSEPEIAAFCLRYVERFAEDTATVEEFALAIGNSDDEPALTGLLSLLEPWFNMSSRLWAGTSIKPVVGAPSLLGLRVLLNCAAKALDNMSLDFVKLVLSKQFQTEDEQRRIRSGSVMDRPNLFYSQGMLGRADLTTSYITVSSWEHLRLRDMFAVHQDYLDALAGVFFIVALVQEARRPDDPGPFYPGFKRIPDSSSAINRLMLRISSDSANLRELAALVDEDVPTFRREWPARVERLNQRPADRFPGFQFWSPIRTEI